MATNSQTRTSLTLEEFLKGSRIDEKPYLEYVDGRIEGKVSPQKKHSAIQKRLIRALDDFAGPLDLGEAFPELRCSFAGLSLVPDIVFLLNPRIHYDDSGDLINETFVPPDIHIEIRSPDQSAQKTKAKLGHSSLNTATEETSFPRSSVGMQSGTLLRPLGFDRATLEDDAGASKTAFPRRTVGTRLSSPQIWGRVQREISKLEHSIANGCPLGWYIDPDRRTIDVYRPGIAPERLSPDGFLDGAPVLPGFRLAVAEVFGWLKYRTQKPNTPEADPQ